MHLLYVALRFTKIEAHARLLTERSPSLPSGPLIRSGRERVAVMWQPKERSRALAPGQLILSGTIGA